jgi:uncharacterized protein (TIGR02145 family)
MRRILFIIVLVTVCKATIAQNPQGFTYQAIARDGSGNLLTNHLLPVKIAIQTSLTGGILIWEELHSVTTDQFGAMSLVIGTGSRQGGSVLLFSDIDWGKQTLFLKTSIQYPGPGFTVMGTTQLWSVPYSMVAKELGGPVKKLGVAGTTSDMEEALFEVKNKNGQTVFAVYNEGVRIYVDDGDSKGAKGGFSIGGFSTTKAPGQEYFVVNADSIRAYIAPGLVKGAKGGFAIGGFSTVKAQPEEYLRVTRDSIRAYINNISGKARKGGFAIGGFSTTKGVPNDYMLISPDSTNFYVKTLSPDVSSTFNILGLDQNLVQKSLLNANSDTISVFGVMNVQNDLIVNGDIDVNGKINLDTVTVADIDGNRYKTVLIGTQRWMAENLKSTKSNDNTIIPLVTDDSEWETLASPGYCWYDNDATSYKTTYGALYNWYAVNTGKLCPTGWHVSTDAEWTTLTSYLGDESVAGGKLKETGTTHWSTPNTGGTNKSGFTALPGGYRATDGTYYNIGYHGEWWSSTERDILLAWERYMSFNISSIMIFGYPKQEGHSIRCLKDN